MNWYGKILWITDRGADMETKYYEVVSIDGDYANLRRTDIESDDLKLVKLMRAAS